MNNPKIEKKLKYNKETVHTRQGGGGICGFDGVVCMQHPNAFYAFYDLIFEKKPTTIIEIGTAAGGFSRFLDFSIKELDLKTHLISYDVRKNHYHDDLVKDTDVDFRLYDVFSSENKHLFEDLINDIQSTGLTLVLCDGGNKVSEFNMLSPHLKSGDIIMCHDYSHSIEYFESHINNKIWSFCESTYSGICSSVENYQLKPFREDVFSQCVWGSFIKI